MRNLGISANLRLQRSLNFKKNRYISPQKINETLDLLTEKAIWAICNTAA